MTHQFVFMVPEPTTALSSRQVQEGVVAFADYLREAGVGQFEGLFFESMKSLEDHLAAEREAGRSPAFAVLPSLIAYSRASSWGISPFLCPVQKGSILGGRVVLVPRSHPASTLRDLKGARLAAARIWAEAPALLGTLMLEDGTDAGRFFGEIVPLASQQDILLAIRRNRADAGLVSRGFFDDAAERNVGVWRDFRVLADVDETHLAGFFAFAAAPTDVLETMQQAALGASSSDAGQHILDLFRLDGFRVCDRDEFALVEGRMLGQESVASSTSSPAPGPTPGEVPCARMEVESDPDSGELTLIVSFDGSAPVAVAARVRFDGEPPVRHELECAAHLCILSLSGEGRRSLEVTLDPGDGTSCRSHRYLLGGDP